MRNYINKWSFMRLFRLILGVLIIIQGFVSKEWLFVGLGGLFTLMPLLNIGCGCGNNGCKT